LSRGQLFNITHTTFSTRDTATFLPFLRALRATQMPPLGQLVQRVLGRDFGIGAEHPVRPPRIVAALTD
jgi:hypothetical protein